MHIDPVISDGMVPKNKRIISIAAIFVAIAIVIAAILILTQPKPHPLGLSIYTNESTLLPEYKILYSNANSNSLLIDEEYGMPPRVYFSYYNSPQVFPRIIFANNYSELISSNSSLYVNDLALAKRFNFSGSDYIGYDVENWSLTPVAEQDNMTKYTQLSCDYVHLEGYKFAFTPEIDIKGWGQFGDVNWTCVNLLDLQEQFLSSNPSALASNVTQMLAKSKAKNPNLTVFVQLDMAGDLRLGH